MEADNIGPGQLISIHALLAESDGANFQTSPISSAISIHALLAESDHMPSSRLWLRIYFYPRSPCGERPRLQAQQLLSFHISIHALLAESDRRAGTALDCYSHFYPRSPCGERPEGRSPQTPIFSFLSPRSLRRATSDAPVVNHADIIFLSTLSLRRATD